jgi:predicted XRE-type DNA-binding protein
MIVRLLKPWKFWSVGRILSDCPDGAANMLIKRGVAEQVQQVKQEKPKKERVRG